MAGTGTGAIFVGLAAAVLGLGIAGSAEDAVATLTPTASPPPTHAAPAATPGRILVVRPQAGRQPSGNAAPTTAGRRAIDDRFAMTPCAAAGRQREVETALSRLSAYRTVTVDGRQSPADCAVIRRFQRRFGILPANGQVDAATADVAGRIAESTAAAGQRCGSSSGTTACVDLTRQTAWVMRDGKVIFGPTVVRTGFRGYATPTGTYTINKRALREWSDPYQVWLPYWQRFIGGIGFHETTTYLHDASLGSHGCVNLLRQDAVAMWNELDMNSTVRVLGRRPGT